MKRAIKKQARTVWEVPYSQKKQLAYATIEEWLYKYRRGGLQALKPAPRGDTGSSRALSEEAQEAVEELLEAHPELTAPLIIKELEAKRVLQAGEVAGDLRRAAVAVEHRVARRASMVRRPSGPHP